MLFNAACGGCRPAALTVAVTDHMLDIPPFLRRDLHPEYNDAPPIAFAGGAPKLENLQTGIDRFRAYETDEDRRLRRYYQNLEGSISEAVAVEQKERRAERAEAKKAEKAKLHENKLRQRKTFVKSFKWGIDGL